VSLFFVKKGGFFLGDYIPCYSQTGGHLSDREKPRDHIPRKHDEEGESYKSFGLLKFGEINYKEFDEQAKVMEVLVSSKLRRPTTRSSTS